MQVSQIMESIFGQVISIFFIMSKKKEPPLTKKKKKKKTYLENFVAFIIMLLFATFTKYIAAVYTEEIAECTFVFVTILIEFRI